ncbi:P-loop NTPase fold protein [Microbacterium sp. LWH13-1.2]|uniref:KAP family P-loop NTPase fold protein n=1 Tax=Microbacterium sp. LWH13-1.2 TaxID=3135260 RepID=UPI0031397638
MADHVDVTTDKITHAALSADDLISNAPLRPNENGSVPESADRFQHRIVAKRVAQLIAAGETSVNIAVNGPWGSGKSTFFGLLKEELDTYKRATWFTRRLRKVPFLEPHVKDKKPRFTPVDFDAWQMADETFESNFLATVAPHVPHSPKNIEQRLFQANRSVNLPLGIEITHPVLKVLLNILLVLVLAFVVFVVPWFQANAGVADPFTWEHLWTKYVPALIAWTTAAAGGTLLVVLLGVVTKLWSVTVEESGPAHVTQFRKIFTEILKRSKTTQVILVDELDRCAPAATMSTLEGLRRFVGEDNCIFVVAFDRESVVATAEDEMLRTVPHRPGRPYYSTAGEYLDKIFTYQIALPPQPRKGFRKYARDLIAEKQGGVWGELRTRYGQEALDRVISILSPPHLTSPRRTKVILNDFAINARMVHSFRNSWTERADEIAVLTVLQTEFPLFYADLEHYPSLLTHVAKRATTDPGETIAPLVKQYTEKRAAYDAVFTWGLEAAPSGSDGSPTPSAPNNAVSIALGQQLERYLEKLRDMQVTLPMADLIQLGTGERMLQFENPAVFAAVEAATEVPRTETLALLEKASSNDRYRAVEMMLNSIEGEPSAEAMSLRGLSGALLSSLDEGHRRALLPQVAGSWDRIVAADAVLQLDDSATLGYVRALAPTKDQEWVGGVLRTTYPNPQLMAPAIYAMTELAPASTLHAARHELVDTAISVVREDPRVLESLISRLDQGQSAGLELADAKRLADLLSTDDIPGDDTARLDQVRAATDSLLRFHEALSVTNTRAWLAKVFRIRAIGNSEAIPNYLRVVGSGLRDESTRVAAADEMLEALAAKAPSQFKSAVAKHLPVEGVAPSTKRLLPALGALLRIVTKDDARDPKPVVSGISAVVALMPQEFDFPADSVVDILERAYRSPGEVPPERLDTLLSVSDALSRLPALTKVMHEFAATLLVSMTSDEREQSHLTHALSQVRAQPADVLVPVVDTLRAQLPQVQAASVGPVAMIFHAQQRLLDLRRKVKALSYDEISPHYAFIGGDILPPWIATAPTVDDLRIAFDGAGYSAVPDQAWQVYAQRAPQMDRSILWREAADLEEDANTLRAIASRGIDSRFIEDAANAITAAPDMHARSAAARIYATLPRNTVVVAALVEPLEALLKTASRADAPLVADLLVRFAGAFGKEGHTRLDAQVNAWLMYVRDALPETTMEELARSRWMRPREKVRRRKSE